MSRPGARDREGRWTEEERRRLLGELFRKHAPRVLDYARYRGATLVEAEDVVSEVFIVLTRRLEDAPDEILPWLFGVARKVMCNQMRGKRRRLALSQRVAREVVPDPVDAVEAAVAPVDDVVIGEALSMLSDRDREAILLVAWDELTYAEAAQSLGCTPAAFAQTLRRARQRAVVIVDELCGGDAADSALRGMAE